MTALALGARLALTGGRDSRLRAVLSAGGVALGVLVLLIAASIPAMVNGRDNREAARIPIVSADGPATASTLLAQNISTTFRGTDIGGLSLQPEGRAPVRPPGVSRLPGPGELVLSPALRDLLRSSQGALLRPRFPGRVVGTIAAAGLSGPSELFFYAGTSGLHDRGQTERVMGFGSNSNDHIPAFLTFLVVIAVVVLVVPIAAFVATAVRFGGDALDRRLAALRLVGADRAMAVRFAAGDALVGALGGLVLGGSLFLLIRPLVGHVELSGISVYPGDVTPLAGATLLIVIGVPLVAVVASVLALRRVVIEPLGVVRRSAQTQRRLVWRLVPIVIGGLYLFSLKGRLVSGRSLDEYQVAVAMLFVLAGLAMLLPWLVEFAIRRVGGGSLPWQLATRRLRLDVGIAARAVSGVVIAVAGAIALQTLFTAAENASTLRDNFGGIRADLIVGGQPYRFSESTLASARAVPGVASVSSVQAQPGGGSPQLIVGDCASLRAYATIGACTDGDVFVASPQGGSPPAGPGGVMRIGAAPGARSQVWHVPASARAVPALVNPLESPTNAVLATPAAMRGLAIADWDTNTFIDLVPGSPLRGDAIERERNVFAQVSPLFQIQTITDTRQLSAFQNISHAIFAGSVIALVLLGASLLVGALEQLRDRRRALAVLTAFGVRRSTLAWSVLLQVAIPVVIGLTIAVLTGLGLAYLLLQVGNAPWKVNWLALGGTVGAGAAVVLLVTAATLPALAKLTQPSGLRTE